MKTITSHRMHVITEVHVSGIFKAIRYSRNLAFLISLDNDVMYIETSCFLTFL